MPETTTLSPPRVMLNVRDIQASLDWYAAIGFTTLKTNLAWDPDCELNWAVVGCGPCQLMLSVGGHDGPKPDVTLFMDAPDVDAWFAMASPHARVDYPPTDQFYGRRDCQVLDLDGYKLNVGQAI